MILLVFLVARLLLLSLFLADFVLVRLEHLQHARDCRPIMPLSGTSADSDRLGDISSTVDASNEHAAIAPNACTTLCEISLSLLYLYSYYTSGIVTRASRAPVVGQRASIFRPFLNDPVVLLITC